MNDPIVIIDIHPVVSVEAKWPDGRKVLFTYEATPQFVKELDAMIDATESMRRAGGTEPGWKLYAPAESVVPPDVLAHLRLLVRQKIEQMVADAMNEINGSAAQSRTERN